MKAFISALIAPFLFFTSVLGMSIVANFSEAPKFRTQGIPEIHGDTLEIKIWSLDSSNYFFYPFGEYSEEIVFAHAISKGYPLVKSKQVNGMKAYMFSNSKGDSLRFVFTERSEIGKFEIASVAIASPSRSLRKGIRINMGKSLFFHTFFRDYPAKEWKKCKVIATITGPIDETGMQTEETIRHYYTFESDRLKRIEIYSKYASNN
jgi:hypothetical protein